MPKPFDSRLLLQNAWRATPGTFAQRLSGGKWRLYRHLRELSFLLTQAVAGRCPRLIISMPPRHGKSALVSHWFPVWFLDLFPQYRVILASYESDYAASWGRKVRNTIQEHSGELRVEISGDSSAADRWDTTEGGGMNAVGTQGAVTGKGAQLLIVDDPHKDREQAESLTMREKVWDWWTGTARERLEPMPWAPFGVVIVMATRWHVDDFTGRLVGRKVDAEAGGQRYSPPWIEYRLPALAELEDPLGRQPGEALWPEKYPLPSLYAIKEDIGPYNWLSEYQQTPIRREGALFRQEYFRPVEVLG
ncbi:MAG: terminase family protein [Methanothrix sp.]